ncbi:MAG: TonB-dependent receptor [Acidocella sp.]|nr:TonB-dependent receptor [Acidocella sp.]
MNISKAPVHGRQPVAFASLAGLLCLSTALVRPAFAADTPPANAVTTQLQPVIVVAQHRAQKAQKVGISMSTVSARRLQEDGVTRVNGLEYEVPNLQVMPQFGTGQPSFAIRGVGTDFNDYASNNAPVVGYYVDDVAYPIPSMTQGQFFDISRIEVLRGPQGTLYGRNTTAGAINVITNKPTDHLTYGGSVEYGTYNNAILEGYISGPITDNLRIRLAGQTDQGGGYLYNRTTGQSFGNNATKNLRGEIAWDPTSDLSFLLNVHWGRDQSDGEASSLLDPRGIYPADSSPRAVGWGTTTGFANEVGISPDAKPFRNNQGWGVDLTTNYKLPFARITSISSVERLDRREYDALDGTNYGAADVYFSTRAGAYAEDLRIASLTENPYNWLLGAYFSRETMDEVYDSGFSTFGLYVHTPYTQSVETKSLYAHAEYDLLPKLKLVLGGRIENEHRKIDNFSTSAYLLSNNALAIAEGPSSASTYYTLPSWKAELDYQLLPETMLYASVTSGVKSGGFTAVNAVVPAGLAISPYKPERLLAYEIGAKNEFFNNTLLVNADAFYYDYRDQQVLGVIVDPNYGAVGHFVNAPKSHLYGAEGEVDWLPLPGLSINQSLGFTAGAFDEFNDTIGAAGSPGSYTALTQNLKGRGIGAPRYTYTLAASYTHPIDDDFNLRVGGSFAYRDQYVSLLNTSTQSFNITPYSLLNFDVTLLPTHNRWRFSVWGRNVLNRKYLISNNYFDSSAYAVGTYGEPATYGVRLSYDFQ